MNEHLSQIPPACLAALQAIEADPLNLPEAVHQHLRTCTACAEARVQWLALEDTPHALAPAGYFDHLPERILRKLPAKRRHPFVSSGWLWAAAALLILAGGVGGFLAGRANRTPVVEASAPKTSVELVDVMPDTPFEDSEDSLWQLSNMSQDEADAVLKRLESHKTEKP